MDQYDIDILSLTYDERHGPDQTIKEHMNVKSHQNDDGNLKLTVFSNKEDGSYMQQDASLLKIVLELYR